MSDTYRRTLYIVYFVISRDTLYDVMTLHVLLVVEVVVCDADRRWSTCTILDALTVVFRHLCA